MTMPGIWIWILLDDVYVDFCRGTSASGCPVLLFTYIHFTRSWVGLKGRGGKYISISIIYSQQSFMIITGRRMSGCYTCYKIKMDCIDL